MLNLTWIDWIGLAAGSLTTVSFVPQVYRTWKTRSTDDLSLGMFSLFTTGVTLWVVFGYLLNSTPIILTNVVTLILSGTILLFKIRSCKSSNLRVNEEKRTESKD